MREINIMLPSSFMNCGITANNYFVADTNYSIKFEKLKIQLPRGKWSIKSNKNNHVVLQLKLTKLQKLFGRYYLGIPLLILIGYAIYKIINVL